MILKLSPNILGILFVLLFTSHSMAQINLDSVYIQEHNYSSKKFAEIIDLLEEQTKVSFSYSSNVVDVDLVYRFSKKVSSFRHFLDKLVDQQGVAYVRSEGGKILFVQQDSNQDKTPATKKIFGVIRDDETGDILIGATLISLDGSIGTISNSFGYYGLAIESKHAGIRVSYIGYEPQTIPFNVLQARQNISLKPLLVLDEIVVYPNVRDEKDMRKEVFQKKLEDINSIIGHSDVLKGIKKLPGVQSASEIQSNFVVRGGAQDQNLILMDGMPMYEVNHLLGISSIFNADAVNNVEFFADEISPKYGGRLSSVTNIEMKSGNHFKHKFDVSVGLVGSKFHLEGPIIKGKSAFNLTGRVSHINQLIKPLSRRVLKLDGTSFEYIDFNFKFSTKIGEKGTLYLGTYVGSDVISFDETSSFYNKDTFVLKKTSNEIYWSNLFFNGRYTHIINDQVFTSVSLSSVNYNIGTISKNDYTYSLNNDFLNEKNFDFIANSDILDFNFANDWEFNVNNHHEIYFGFGAMRHTYLPTIGQKFSSDADTLRNLEYIKAYEQYYYFEDVLKLSNRFSIRSGFRYSTFKSAGNYFSFLPRIALTYDREHWKSVLSYRKMTQYVHLLNNPTIGLPTDLWLPSTNLIPPEYLHQLALNTTKNWSENLLSEVSVYAKKYENLLEYRSAINTFSPIINETTLPIFNDSKDWEKRIEIGSGYALGLDAGVSWKLPKSIFHLKYSYCRSKQKFENINRGQYFPFKYDRTHDLHIGWSYRVSDKINLSTNWYYGSGHYVTFALLQYKTIGGEQVYDYSQRNNFQLPDFHRLDVNMAYKTRYRDGLIECNLGLFNVYNRKNPYYIRIDASADNKAVKVKQVSIFPLLPSLNIKYHFKYFEK